MVEGVISVTHVEGVAVRKERLAAKAFDVVAQHAGILLPQERHIAHLAEVELHGYELVLEINLLYPGAGDKAVELAQQAVAHAHMHVGEIYFRGHNEIFFAKIQRLFETGALQSKKNVYLCKLKLIH